MSEKRKSAPMSESETPIAKLARPNPLIKAIKAVIAYLEKEQDHYISVINGMEEDEKNKVVATMEKEQENSDMEEDDDKKFKNLTACMKAIKPLRAYMKEEEDKYLAVINANLNGEEDTSDELVSCMEAIKTLRDYMEKDEDKYENYLSVLDEMEETLNGADDTESEED